MHNTEKSIKEEIDRILKKYSKEYEELGKISEELYNKREELEEKYVELDKKTGLNSLFEKLAKIKENQ